MLISMADEQLGKGNLPQKREDRVLPRGVGA
jgi:hypothetical protein